MWTPKHSNTSIFLPKMFERLWVNSFATSHIAQFPFTISEAGYSSWPKQIAFSHAKRPRWGIELILSGNLELVQNKRRSLVSAGSCCILKYGEDQQYTSGPAGFVNKRWISVIGPAVENFIADSGIAQYDVVPLTGPNHIAAISAAFKRAGVVLAENSPQAGKELCTIVWNIWMDLLTSIHGNQYPTPLTMSLDFIAKNIDKKLTLDQIAQAGRVSPQYIRQLFQRHLHDSPINYFTKRKIEYARRLLTQSSLTIKEIAVRIGYQDPFLFSKQFKRNVGVSPQHFRKDPFWFYIDKTNPAEV